MRSVTVGAPRLRGGEASPPGQGCEGRSRRSRRRGRLWAPKAGPGVAGHRPAHWRPGVRSPAGGTATLELELEFGGAGGQRLLPADPGAENESEAVASVRKGRAQSVLRWFTTVVLCAAFLGLGLSVAILGPTFPDLAKNVNRNISSLSLIFVGRASGYLCGSMIGGVLFGCINHFLLLGVSLSATTVGLYLMPFCKTAALLILMMSVFGVSMGILDTGHCYLLRGA